MYGMDLQERKRRTAGLILVAAVVLGWIVWELAPYAPWSV